MRQMAIGICAGLVAAVALFASFNTDALKPSLAQAQTASTKSTDCSTTSSQQMITQVVAAVPGKVLGFFVCVADIDGTGKQAIVVGRYAESGGTLSIITNTGAVRKQMSW